MLGRDAKRLPVAIAMAVALGVSAAVAGNPADGIVSDDFAGGVLDPVWSISGPVGISSQLGTSTTDAYLELETPDGNYDAWFTNNAVRAMQASADTDFQLETRFLTTPTEKYQMQGILVEQDANNWIRFDTYSDGNRLRAFAAMTLDGVSSQQVRVVIPGDSAPYLRVTRSGIQWNFEYSIDGTTWVVAGSFTHALAVTSVGVFAGNTGNATGYTAQVDYFENTADPILNEDGVIVPVNQPPDAVDDAFATVEDTDLLLNVLTDLLANDSDPEGDPLSFAILTQPLNGALIDNGDGTLSYTPNASFVGDDSFTYTLSDGTLSDIATVSISFTGDGPPPPASVKRLKATNYCVDCDLSRADLRHANLTGANLFRANLRKANLTGANLTGANLFGADLSRADLRHANLTGANLSGAKLRKADLKNANLTGANLFGVDLRRADLTNANLTDAFLRKADLRNADLTDADLAPAKMMYANLTSANLTGADMSGAYLSKADLRNANLTGANLFGADLRRASLSNANLSSAYLRTADLKNADLTDANLFRANLTGADLRRVDLTDANLWRADLTNANITNANLTDANLCKTKIVGYDGNLDCP